MDVVDYTFVMIVFCMVDGSVDVDVCHDCVLYG